MIGSQEFERVYNEIRLLMQAELYEAANHAMPELETVAVTNMQLQICFALQDVIAQKLDEPGEEENQPMLKTIKDYSDELLLNRWREERELLLDLGDLLSGYHGSVKRHAELTEDHARHSQYVKEFREEMKARGMFNEDGSLKQEYKKFLL